MAWAINHARQGARRKRRVGTLLDYSSTPGTMMGMIIDTTTRLRRNTKRVHKKGDETCRPSTKG